MSRTVQHWKKPEQNVRAMALLIFETETMESDILQTFLPYFLIESTLSYLCKTTLIKSSTERKRKTTFLLWELKAPHDMRVQIQENVFSGMVKEWLCATSVSWAGVIQTGKGWELGRFKGLYSYMTCELCRKFPYFLLRNPGQKLAIMCNEITVSVGRMHCACVALVEEAEVVSL